MIRIINQQLLETIKEFLIIFIVTSLTTIALVFFTQRAFAEEFDRDRKEHEFSIQDSPSEHGLQIAEDLNPDPLVVEINLEARVDYVEFVSGIPVKVYTYNGTVPGPMIKARVGDTLLVHFTNNLPESTTIHWHGLRLPAAMDGSTVAQNPIQPGETFDYEFVLKDASLFWYHPHVRSNVQVEKGLAGTLLVSPRKRNRQLSKTLKNQQVLVLDDVLLNAHGQIAEAYQGTPEEVLLTKLNGREGNTLLVNGRQLPSIKVRSGEPVRWRLANIANTRFMNIEIPEHTLTRIGGDGGLLETPQSGLKNVLLVPGERKDMVFVPKGKPGSELIVYWIDSKRGRHTINIMENGMAKMGHDHSDGEHARIPLLKLRFAEDDVDNDEDEQRHNVLRLPSRLRTIQPIDVTDATETTLKFGHSMPMADGSIKFLINGKTFAQLDSNDTPDAKVGETQIWNLVNKTGADHPFHLHGFFFQPLEIVTKDENGDIIEVIPAAYIEDKDTVNLPRRPGGKGSTSTLRVVIKFDPAPGLNAADIQANGGVAAIVNADKSQKGHSGGWQFHCHILEHVEAGMMSFVEVRE